MVRYGGFRSASQLAAVLTLAQPGLRQARFRSGARCCAIASSDDSPRLKLGLLRGASSERSVRARDSVSMACNPSLRMLRAALWSLPSEQPQEHWCHRSSSSFWTIAPQPLHIWLVYLGETNSTREPAHSALFLHICWNIPQPASKIDLFRPALALAPLGRYCPVASSCFGFGRLLILAG